MAKYICKNPKCKCEYEYCRGCLISPIPYKEAGFCSVVCYEKSKKTAETTTPQEIVEVIIPDESSEVVENVAKHSIMSIEELKLKTRNKAIKEVIPAEDVEVVINNDKDTSISK